MCKPVVAALSSAAFACHEQLDAAPGRFAEGCVHELFEAQAAASPHAVAVVHENVQLTYGELNARANRLARHLRSAGVAPDTRVVLCVKRSIEMVVGVLAVLKAGGAYVPLDPAYPLERLAFMLEDSAPVAVLTHGAVPPTVRTMLQSAVGPDVAPIDLQADAARWEAQSETDLGRASLTPANLAYVIYTSGSTGHPKGVLVEHAGVCSLAATQAEFLAVGAGSRVLQFASLSFDACVWELVMSLCTGASLHVPAPDAVLAGDALVEVVREHGITHTLLPPAVLAALPAGAALEPVRTLIAGGDALTEALVERWAPGRRLINAYGPTESTVCCTMHECDPAAAGNPPIGRAIANARVYVLDEHGREVPVGVDGELHVGGIGVARGYLNRPELTAERFIASPFVAGDRLYKTGDLARYLPDGTIAFAGRNDFQVKVRGFRIELGEIEARLAQHPEVGQTVVLAREDVPGEKRLTAYYTRERAAAAPAVEALRAHLLAVLPEYMVPAAYVALDALPLTPNGKVDRKALPAPDAAAYAMGSYEAPIGEVETAVAQIWCEVLKLERAGRDDDFFAAGGDSLKAVRAVKLIAERLSAHVSLTEIFLHRTPAQLANAVTGRSPSDTFFEASLSLDAGADERRLSFAQEQVWFLQQLSGENRAYNTNIVVWFDGKLDEDALRESLGRIIARHAVLRTSFRDAGGEPYQEVLDDVPTPLQVVDFTGVPEGARDAEVRAWIEREIRCVFDIAAPPLVRWVLLRIAPERYGLLQIEHHFVHDGWSVSVLLRDIFRCYDDVLNGRPAAEPLEFTFRDYVRWQRAFIDTPAARAQLDFWASHLKDAPAGSSLPADRPRGQTKTFAGAALRRTIAPSAMDALRETAARYNSTPYAFTLAAFSAFLARYNPAGEVVVGGSLANRRVRGTETMLGMLVNMAVYRFRTPRGRPFAELLGEVSASVLGAFDNQEVPFEQIVRMLRPERTLGRNPLFQVSFNFHNSDMPKLDAGELAGRVEYLHNASAKFDLSVISVPRDDGSLEIIWEYDTDLFDAATAQRYLDEFTATLDALAAEPGGAVGVPSLFDAERQTMLVEWNATDAPYPAERCIHELFEAQAAAHPHAVAVVHGDAKYTYAELNAHANQLARYLCGAGVEPDTRVAILLDRSIELVVAELAVLKCGATYVPLDQNAPAERQKFMLEDCGIRIALSARAQKLPAGTTVRRIDVDELALSAESCDDLGLTQSSDAAAYVMYTSGSTGQAKGVVVPHRAIGRLVLNNGYAEFAPTDRVAFAANPAFDASTMEVWAPLLNGGCIVVIDRDAFLDANRFAQVLERQRVSVLFITTALFNEYAFAIPAALKRLRVLLCGGEQNQPRAFAQVLQGDAKPEHLIHCYGPTETTTFAVTLDVTGVPDGTTNIPIGRPIGNTRVYIVDPQGEPVPVGVTGEILIGGAGVAHGY